MDDTRMRELVVDAYRDVQLDVPLATIEGAAARTRPRTVAAAAAGAMVVALGAGVYFGTAGPAPVTAPFAAASASTASTVGPEMVVSGAGPSFAIPPLRFSVDLDGFTIKVHADERAEVDTVERADRSRPQPMALWIADWRGGYAHPAGQLSNHTSTIIQGDFRAGLSFGRAPVGTTKVEIHLAGGGTVEARLSGEWYLAVATGDAGRALATASSVVATTPSGTVSIPVR
jgi:hypothetical protein